MAFLCRARVWKGKKGNKPKRFPKDALFGRITGSDSVDTLVKVGISKELGIEPQTRMRVLHDFTPCVNDELEVKQGDIVHVLYQENDWVYVISDNGGEGFIPCAYCVQQHGEPSQRHYSSARPAETEIPEEPDSEDTALLSPASDLNLRTFRKTPVGQYVVLFNFIAMDENDVSVQRGESVTVLNRDDPDWIWVMKADGREGFVPRKFLASDISSVSYVDLDGLSMSSDSSKDESDRLYHGTELVALYDYQGTAPDDLTISRGEYLIVDLSNQQQDGWLWAYSPRTKKEGYIPRAYARPPATTAL
ncbi:SH3 domain-containing protein Dlish-like [Ptychodera flava]|uniref:SH3 domain-containing protein Dlish-like n=1 Tax=Ptychodera flava TaxID=63121 RepID=UPI00396AAA74